MSTHSLSDLLQEMERLRRELADVTAILAGPTEEQYEALEQILRGALAAWTVRDPESKALRHYADRYLDHLILHQTQL